MSWHAVRAIREAGVTTRAFLLPTGRGRWLRLVALSLIVGVGWLSPLLVRLAVPSSGVADGVAAPLVTTAIGFLALFGVVGDAYGRFALVSALRSRQLSLTEDVRWRLGRAVRWTAFAFGSGVLVVAAAGVALRALRAGWLTVTGGDPATPIGVVVTAFAGSIAALVVVAAVGFVHATLSLLPAAMLATGVGAVASWRRLRRAFADHRGGFLGYLFVRGLVAVGVVVVSLLAAGAVIAGLTVVAFVVTVALFGTVADGIAALGGPRLVGGGLLTALSLAVLPVRAVAITYRSSYDLAVLGAADPDLALLDTGTVDAFAGNDAVSVVVPDGAPSGEPAESDPGLGHEATGGFQFGAVETEEE